MIKATAHSANVSVIVNQERERFAKTGRKLV